MGRDAAAASQSYVTVLADHGGVLAAVGQVSGLGAGQQIYSVRFIGDAGYVVTFRRVDPLYTIDLSSPTSPRVAGQLELEGYSAYLHPVAEGLLLGIGQEVGPENEPSGAQLELFDVSNPAAPRLKARATLGSGSSSQVQYDHHAFLFWPPTALAVLPLSIYSTTPVSVPPTPQPLPAAGSSGGQASTGESTGGFVGAIGFRVDRSGHHRGRADRPRPGQWRKSADRSLARDRPAAVHRLERGGDGLQPRHARTPGLRDVPLAAARRRRNLLATRRAIRLTRPFAQTPALDSGHAVKLERAHDRIAVVGEPIIASTSRWAVRLLRRPR